MVCLKVLSRGSKLWSSQPDLANHELFVNDPVKKEGVSAAKAAMLNYNGKNTVQDMVCLGQDDKELNSIVKSTR